MKVRTRLMLAFAYILATVIIALEIPLAITLQRRALAELEARTLADAQIIAGRIGRENVGKPGTVGRIADDAAARIPGSRIVVVNLDGDLVADSQGTDEVGSHYATNERPELQRALQGDATTIVRRSDDLGTDLLAVAAPIVDEGLAGAVRITIPMDDVTANVRRVTVGLLVIGVAGLAAGLLIAVVMASSLSKPLVRLASAARRLGAGGLDARAGDIRGPSEVRDLARSFDDMAERLQAAVQTERDFVHNASHQLRTPLTGMKLRLEAAVDAAETPEARRRLEAAEAEVDRLAGIVDRLLPSARSDEPGSTSLRDAATRAIARWEARAAQAGSTIDLAGSDAHVRGDPDDFDQILDNLIDNAITYAPGPIRITTGVVNGVPVLTVQDRGPGIPPDELGRVTERFYRGRGAPAGGSGLGLAIVSDLADHLGGTIEVADAPGGGVIVTLRFAPADPP